MDHGVKEIAERVDGDGDRKHLPRGRRTLERSDGTRSDLCSRCDARLRSSREDKRLTHDEVRSIVENGSMTATT
jgi:hypothetical protein